MIYLRGKKFRNLFMTVIPLLVLVRTLSIWLLKFNFSSRMMPKCFCWLALCTWTLLKWIIGWVIFEFFLENNTSCAGFLGSGLNDIFHLYAHLEMMSRSFVRSLALSSLFLTTEKREVPFANNLTLDFNPSGISLIYMYRKGWETANLRYRKTRNLILVDYNTLMAPGSMFASFLRAEY